MNASISRVLRSRAEARATYDRISRWYDVLEGHWEKRSKERGLELLAVSEGETVLEIGSGTGHGVVHLARRVGTGGKVLAVDLSRGMLEKTRSAVNKAGFAERVTLMCSDAEELPLDSLSVDAVYLSYTLELFDTPEIPRVLGEIRRVLRPGGRLCAVSLSKLGSPTFMRHLYEWGHEAFPKLLDCRPIYVRQALEDAEFRISSSERMSLIGMPVEIVLARKANLSNPASTSLPGVPREDR